MVVIKRDHQILSHNTDSDDSLNRLADNRKSIDKLKSQLLYD